MEYSFKEMPDLHGKGKRLMVPEPTFCNQISYKDFLKECASSGSGFTEADIDGAVRRIVNRLNFYLDMGHSVKIDGMGTFRVKLGMKKGEEVLSVDELKGQRHPTEKVEIEGIQFRADTEWLAKLKGKCELTYSGMDRHRRKVMTTPEERLRMALDYLDTHHEMRLPEYMRLTGLSKTTASLELRRFRHDPNSGIMGIGNRNQLRYVRKWTWGEAPKN
jgi:predicted histone-like DNA-binding protein